MAAFRFALHAASAASPAAWRDLARKAEDLGYSTPSVPDNLDDRWAPVIAELPAPERPSRIGIFGGTFDPPHAGHVAAAHAVIEQLGLDRLLLVVANDPWQKSGQRTVSPAADRYRLDRGPGRGDPRCRGEPARNRAGRPQLLGGHSRGDPGGRGRPADELFLVVGADLVPELGSWHRCEDLQSLVTLAVVSRPSGPAPGSSPWLAGQTGWTAPRCPFPARRSVRCWRGGPVEGMVPEAVIHCIRRHGLYAGG